MPELGGLFIVSFLAATILPMQSELIFVGLAALGEHSWAALLMVASFGNTLGSAVNWLLGRLLLRFQNRRWFPAKGAAYERAQRWFASYGVWTLLFAWTPFVGDALTVLAGALRISFATFLVLVALGKTARYVALLVLAEPLL